MSTTEIIEVPLSRLVIDPALQVRQAGLDGGHVASLEEAIDQLPPPKAVRRGKEIVIEDGHHTVAAHQNAGREKISVEIVQPPEDGDLYAAAFESNRLHGKALTLADKTAFAAHLIRQDPSTPNMRIAERAGLAPGTVQRIRQDLEREGSVQASDRVVTRGEQTYAYPAPRKPGELPVPGIGEALGNVGTRLFSRPERIRQRKIATYLRRLLVALEDGDDLLTDEGEVKTALEAVLGEDEARSLADDLGARAVVLVACAEALGFSLEG